MEKSISATPAKAKKILAHVYQTDRGAVYTGDKKGVHGAAVTAKFSDGMVVLQSSVITSESELNEFIPAEYR